MIEFVGKGILSRYEMKAVLKFIESRLMNCPDIY